MKRFLFACNFKMNVIDAKEYKLAMKDDDYSSLILCPNFCDLKDYAKLKKSNKIFLGAQNVSEFESGAHTGETSAAMLSCCGVQFCIVGHSERVNYNIETLYQTNQKLQQLIKNSITPIVCVGEDLFRDESKQTDFAIRSVLGQLNEILKDIDTSKIVLAYEPIWAIGTGKVASQEHIKQVVDAIKKYTGVEVVLYGGSFNENNFQDIAQIDCVDGALIGGASLKPKSICMMYETLNKK